MANKEMRAFLKRFRRFCHNTLLLGENRYVGNYSGNIFCERAFKDPSTKLEQRDFLRAQAGDATITNNRTLEVGWSAIRAGRAPFSRYYLVTRIIEGDVETQAVTFHIYEHRFSGAFALWRAPLWRKREITVPVSALEGSYQNVRNIWEPGVDEDWRRGDVIGRKSIEGLRHYMRHLSF